MSKPPYANSSEAFRAIHEYLAHEVEAQLESGQVDEALSSAHCMEKVEDHLMPRMTVGGGCAGEVKIEGFVK